ncbi:peptidylprolyl isomerase [Candidatus Woesearchaeota archaeon]|nr:peptidylprolyl isomerase [Candidatus Woesearchaeota archaeon]
MKPGSKVKVHYTGSLNDGSIFDSSEGREPLEFTLGEGQVIKGFEDGVASMGLNEEKTIKINPEEAYGQKNEQLVIKVPRDQFPKEIEVGGKLMLKGPQGQQLPAEITNIAEDQVTIDLNHPLAGKELNFKLKLIAID